MNNIPAYKDYNGSAALSEKANCFSLKCRQYRVVSDMPCIMDIAYVY